MTTCLFGEALRQDIWPCHGTVAIQDSSGRTITVPSASEAHTNVTVKPSGNSFQWTCNGKVQTTTFEDVGQCKLINLDANFDGESTTWTLCSASNGNLCWTPASPSPSPSAPPPSPSPVPSSPSPRPFPPSPSPSPSSPSPFPSSPSPSPSSPSSSPFPHPAHHWPRTVAPGTYRKELEHAEHLEREFRKDVWERYGDSEDFGTSSSVATPLRHSTGRESGNVAKRRHF